ncbi:flagellin [Roseospira marina]|uniref:Flagellin n=1 Tax=Roseospira marina TaxID=140057 RepID=A0A5M6IEX5_9PROT|nr:flagellin [Roseospira marina]KAA5606793.1 flagellin [Roseospira marina]MBB4313785.1 flagellin-like hook-associated protein FlgL [Roseospira marina]MBB5086947.1 flagellin-like hook-associated protein FlgL [Roseospira marina]
MSGITLSTGIQKNLLSLQGTTTNIEKTQFKLSTGKKVNTALDDPIAFFKAQNLNYRASDLSARKDSIVQAQKTVEAASQTLESMLDLVDQARSIFETMASDTSAKAVTGYEKDLNSIKSQMQYLVGDGYYQGVNLLQTSDSLTVKFDENGSSSLAIQGVAASAAGMSSIKYVDAVASQAAAGAAEMETLRDSLRSFAQSFSTQNAILDTRREFTDNMVSTLNTGASELVNADMNEESANMLALQTRQQLGTISLSIANQADQSVLRLF